MNAALLVATFLVAGLLAIPAMAQAAQDKVPILIAFKHNPGPAEEALVHSHGGKIKYTYHLVPAIAASVPEAAVEGLRHNPNVTAVDADVTVYKSDAELDAAWGVKRIGAGVIHDLGNKGAGVKVAVIDTGIDYNHPDLNANYAGGYDFVNSDNDPMDDDGHGTHVSGTIAAEDDGTGVVGVAPSASLYALKVLNASGSGSFSDVIAALQWCVDNGIQVTNNSYGSNRDPGATVKAAFDNAEAAGIVNVAAAGNSGNPKGNGDKVGYPARYSSAIAVAATDSSDNRASFSSTGPAVEISGPGVSITSCKLGGGYVSFSGTSMATPHVAGVAALVISSGISDTNANGKINDEARARLNSTADDLGPAGRDSFYGYGLVDADEAAVPTGPVNSVPVVTIDAPSDGASFASGATISFTGTASDTEDGDLTSVISWTSSIDGLIGAGGSFSAVLSDGVHTITASASDLDGATGHNSISITVGTPPPTPTLNVTVTTDKARYVNREQVVITVHVTSGGSPVSGAAVSATITSANGSLLSGSATTNSNGDAVFGYRVNASRDGVGTYTVNATASKAGYTSGSGSTTFNVTN
ncbi:MAG: S8 family serine peptidase [bacterium]